MFGSVFRSQPPLCRLRPLSVCRLRDSRQAVEWLREPVECLPVGEGSRATRPFVASRLVAVLPYLRQIPFLLASAASNRKTPAQVAMADIVVERVTAAVRSLFDPETLRLRRLIVQASIADNDTV